MVYKYLLLTEAEQDKSRALSIQSREIELHNYLYEKEHHEHAIAQIGDIEWDDETNQYRGYTRDNAMHRIAQEKMPEEFRHKVASLISLERHKAELNSVKFEIAHVTRALNHLLEALPAGAKRDAAFAAIKEDAK